MLKIIFGNPNIDYVVEKNGKCMEVYDHEAEAVAHANRLVKKAKPHDMIAVKAYIEQEICSFYI